MKVVVDCPECGKHLRLSETHLGKQIRCPSCEQRVTLPEVAASAKETPASVLEANETNGVRETDLGAIRSAQPGKSQTGTTPEKIGRFELKTTLGKGSFGKVYRAYDPVLDREVALKVPHAGTLENKTAAQRFLREAKAAAQLRHPHIVPVYDAGGDEDEYYIASAFIEGQTLARFIEEERPDFRRAARIVLELSEGLDYAHSLGIVHRDVKPANVMVDEQGQPHVMDFGLARFEGSEEKLTQDGSIMGTPAYMSPEQATKSNEDVTAASDQYSVGVVLYELLCGELPFSGPPQIVVFNVINQPPPPPHSLNPEIPKDLETICLKAMSKEAEGRFADCQALADDLKRWLDDEPIHARRISRMERFTRWCKREPIVAGLGAAFVLALLIGTAVSNYFASSAAHEAEVAKRERDAAEDARRRAVNSELIAEQRLVESYLERGQSLCELGKVGRGLLWMARSLNSLTPQQADLKRVIQTNIASWRTQLHSQELCLVHRNGVKSVAFSPDGNTIATASDGEVGAHLWNAETGDRIATLPHPNRGVRTLAFNSDGDMLATGSFDGVVKLWHAQDSWSVLRELQLGGSAKSLSFSPDNKFLLTGCGSSRQGNREARLWDVASGNSLATIPHETEVLAVAFSPDGKTFATGSGDGKVGIWNNVTRKPVVTLPPHKSVWCLAFSPNSETLATGGANKVVRFWNASTGEPVGLPLQLGRKVHSVDFSPDGKLCATGCFGRTARVWDFATGDLLGGPIHHQRRVHSVAFHPNGHKIVTGCRDGTARQWRISLRNIDLWSTFTRSVRAAAVSPDGRLIATGNVNGPYLWDGKTGKRSTPDIPYRGDVCCVSFSPDGVMFATGSPDRTVRIWNVNTGAQVGLALQHLHGVIQIAFSASGKSLVTAAGDNMARIWGVNTGKKVCELVHRRDESVSTVAYSPDGSIVATGTGQGTLQFWNAANGNSIGRWNAHQGQINSVVFSPDGTTIATASNDQTVRLLTVPEGKTIGTSMEHAGYVLDVDFSPDGQTIVTGGNDQTARLWDAKTQRLLGRPVLHEFKINSVAFAPDGRSVITALQTNSTNNLHCWTVSVAISGSPKQVELSLQVATGMELRENGAVTFLDSQTWNERKQRLEQLEGRPEPFDVD